MTTPNAHSRHTLLVPALLMLALAGIVAGGYATGAWGQLFTKKSPAETTGAEQRAIDRLFGSDQPFNPNADNITDAARADGDSVSWKTLAHTEVLDGGQSSMHIRYGKDVQVLNGKDIRITGYMFPLQSSEGQSHFLLSAYPASCPYCLPAGPSELIEVTDAPALPFTYEPVALEGKLQLLTKSDDLKGGMFYRMSGVHAVKR